MSAWRGELIKVVAQVKDIGGTVGTALQPSAIGVTVQGYSANLAAWSAVTPASYLTTAAAAAAYQPLDTDLTSWAAIARAAGLDAFVAAPSSANLRSLLTDETGTGAAVFAGAPTITGVPVFSGIPSFTGGALSFPATQVPSAGANDLDDYEEGTYTPVATPQTGAFTTVSTVGAYTKTGRKVTFKADLTITTVGTGAGFINITLPFTNSATRFIVTGRDMTGNAWMLSGTIAPSATVVTLIKYDGTFAGATLCYSGATHTVSGDYWV